MVRLRALELGATSEFVEWAYEDWTETDIWRGLLAYACFAMPSPADASLDAESALAAPQPLLLSATGRLWLEGPLLAHILRQPAVGADRPWVLRALQRLGLAVSLCHGCDATLDVAESAGRACLLLGIGQALLQFMAQTPEDAVRLYQQILSLRSPRSDAVAIGASVVLTSLTTATTFSSAGTQRSGRNAPGHHSAMQSLHSILAAAVTSCCRAATLLVIASSSCCRIFHSACHQR